MHRHTYKQSDSYIPPCVNGGHNKFCIDKTNSVCNKEFQTVPGNIGL